MPSLRVRIACWLIAAGSAAAGPPATLVHLPNAVIMAVQVDASGNIYVAGSHGGPPRTSEDAFVAKLSPDGSKVLYSTTIGGSQFDDATALATDSAGAAYIFGQTQSPDFPVTPGALQSTLMAAEQGFLAKVDAQGKVVYATLLGGGASISPGAGGLIVDSAGNAIVSGQTFGGNFPTTPGAPYASADGSTLFTMRIDSTGGKLLAAVRGVGGLIAADAQGSIYLAGTTSTAIPVTPEAFQSTYQLNGCGGTGQIGFACAYQYVTKLNASLTQIVYSTYLTGSHGATPAAIFVDAQGNALLAGTTNSADYPTTSDAFEPVYIANAPPLQAGIFSEALPPPASGYVTKLNATGTGLVYSTFFSGTQDDTIAFAALTGSGIFLSGQAGSTDLPALDGIPPQCLPETYETRLSLDGSAVTAARIVPGNVLAYDALTGGLLAWNGADLISFDPTAPPTAIACILDAADLRPVASVAPGELLSIFGVRLIDTTYIPDPGSFPKSLGGLTVTLNQIASPLLYASPQQINLQAPYEIAGAAQAGLLLTSTAIHVSDAKMLPVVASNPVAFLDTAPPTAESFANCPLRDAYQGGPLPLAFNSDGSRNSCENPASDGSLVTIFLDGLGAGVPAAATGGVNPSPGVPLNLPVTLGDGSNATVVSAAALPGSISGVWQVAVRVSLSDGNVNQLSLAVNAVPVRDANLTLWIQAAPKIAP